MADKNNSYMHMVVDEPTRQLEQRGFYNPYADVDVTANGLFGNYTDADAANTNVQMAGAQLLADLQLMEYQNEYNDPSAQVARMRRAGLNPDLQGIQSQPSAGASAPAVAPMSGTPDYQVGMQIASTVMQGFQIMSALVGQAGSILQTLNNVGSSARESVDGSLRAMLSNMMPAGVPMVTGTGKDGTKFEDAPLAINAELYSDWIKSLPLSQRRYGKRMYRLLKDTEEHKSLWYAARGTSEESREKYLKYLGRSNYSPLDTVMLKVYGEMADIFRQTEIASAKSGKSRSDFDSAFYSTLDPETAASSQNAANERNKNGTDLRSRLYSTIDKYFPEDDKRPWIQAGRVILPILAEFLMSSSTVQGATSLKSLLK